MTFFLAANHGESEQTSLISPFISVWEKKRRRFGKPAVEPDKSTRFADTICIDVFGRNNPPRQILSLISVALLHFLSLGQERVMEREVKTVSERHTTDVMYIKMEMAQMEKGEECRKKKE